MHTSVVWLALAGLAPQAEATPTWRNDYFQARQKGAAQKKPLAVFLAPGQGGWKKLSAEGGLGDGAKKVLADRYVCVHIDTTTETHTSSRTSSYPSTSGTYAPAFQGWSQPSYGYVPSFSRGGGGGC